MDSWSRCFDLDIYTAMAGIPPQIALPARPTAGLSANKDGAIVAAKLDGAWQYRDDKVC